MAWNGYLLKIGSWTFPMNLIEMDSYDCTPDQRTDMDSTVTATGELWRNVLQHTRSKVELRTTPLTLTQQQTIMSNLRSAWAAAGSELHRECQVNYYDMETDTYKTMHCYTPDIQWSIKSVTNNDIIYNRTRIAFIEK